MFNFKIDARNFMAKMSRLISNAEDTKPIMAAVAARMLNAVEDNFAAEGRPKWKALSDRRLEQRRKMKKTGKILQVSGDLADSVSTRSTNTEAIVGIGRDSYGKFHHGPKMTGHASKGIMPERPFLKLTDGDVEDIKEIIGPHLIEGVS